MIRPVEGQKPPPPFPEGEERDAFAEQTLNDAKDWLDEAESLSPDRHGRSIAHACYYGLFWLARSIIVQQEGTYPWRHDSTEDRLKNIVAAADDHDLTEAYELYLDAAAERAICDYDSSYRPTAERAKEVVEGARRAFDIIAGKFDINYNGGASVGPP